MAHLLVVTLVLVQKQENVANEEDETGELLVGSSVGDFKQIVLHAFVKDLVEMVIFNIAIINEIIGNV